MARRAPAALFLLGGLLSWAGCPGPDDDDSGPADDDATGDDDTTGDDDALWPQDNPQIVFESYHDGGSLFALSRTGAGEPELLETAAPVLTGVAPPALSPDGSSVLFLADLGNGDVGTRHLDLTTGAEVDVVDGGHADWHPDGDRIVYCLDDVLHVAWSNGSDGLPLSLEGQPVAGCDPEWSPDGTRIAYKAIPEVHVVDVSCDGAACEASNPVQLTDNATGGPTHSSHDPSWSPDGQWLTFMTYTGDLPARTVEGAAYHEQVEQLLRWNVEIADPDGGPAEALTEAVDGELVASWLPAFASPPDGGDPADLVYLQTTLMLDEPDGTPASRIVCPYTAFQRLVWPYDGPPEPLLDMDILAPADLDPRLDCAEFDPDLLADHATTLSVFDW